MEGVDEASVTAREQCEGVAAEVSGEVREVGSSGEPQAEIVVGRGKFRSMPGEGRKR